MKSIIVNFTGRFSVHFVLFTPDNSLSVYNTKFKLIHKKLKIYLESDRKIYTILEIQIGINRVTLNFVDTTRTTFPSFGFLIIIPPRRKISSTIAHGIIRYTITKHQSSVIVEDKCLRHGVSFIIPIIRHFAFYIC